MPLYMIDDIELITSFGISKVRQKDGAEDALLLRTHAVLSDGRVA
jgi:hypothetical protein